MIARRKLDFLGADEESPLSVKMEVKEEEERRVLVNIY